MSKTYIAKCDVKLSGATMFVIADSYAEAVEKIARNEWDDIEYAKGAELVDWLADLDTLKEDG